MGNLQLIGPFTQLITMAGLPEKGPISDEKMGIIPNGGVLMNYGVILKVGEFDQLYKNVKQNSIDLIEFEHEAVALPGFVDPHTHLCFAGSRANDYAKRISGKTYLEIANEGGGIWQTVQDTRAADKDQLFDDTLKRGKSLLHTGITTAEVKSGYCLNFEGELKMLKSIKKADEHTEIDLISTCLAAHMKPRDFDGNTEEYLSYILNKLLPEVIGKNLSSRVDIFIEDGAFSELESKKYLIGANRLGFDITIHGDQFSQGGSRVAIETGAISVDHLEASADKEILSLAKSDAISTVLPGASVGLGMPYAPARKLLDAGNAVAIGSDWNPGSAPMGNLLLQASLLSASEKLSNAETFAGITIRASKALNLHDRGVIKQGMVADIIAFPCTDYREILYHQGQLKPNIIIKKGKLINV